MKKTLKFMALLVMAFAITLSSCKKEEEQPTSGGNNNQETFKNVLTFDGDKTEIIDAGYVVFEGEYVIVLMDENENLAMFYTGDDYIPTGNLDLDIEYGDVECVIVYDDIYYVAVQGDLNIEKESSKYILKSEGKVIDSEGSIYEYYPFSCSYKGRFSEVSKSDDRYSKILQNVKK